MVDRYIYIGVGEASESPVAIEASTSLYSRVRRAGMYKIHVTKGKQALVQQCNAAARGNVDCISNRRGEQESSYRQAPRSLR